MYKIKEKQPEKNCKCNEFRQICRPCIKQHLADTKEANRKWRKQMGNYRNV